MSTSSVGPAIVGACCLCGAVSAEIIHVPGDAPTIQAGIDLANEGDEVEVADGVYTGPGNLEIELRGKPIVVRAAGGPGACTIDCEESGRAFLFVGGETDQSRVEGFTIRNGSADAGGAIFIDGADPVIAGCVFEGNAADRGGAIYNILGHPAVSRCSFIGNLARTVDGGGLYNMWGGVSLTGCLFAGNHAVQMGGAVFGDFSTADLVNCTLTRNTADRGGGITNYAGVELTLSNCILWQNEDSSGLGYAAQVNSTASSVVIDHCCVDGLFEQGGAEGSIDDDPRFADAAGGDFRLGSGSPCTDAGRNAAVPPGVTVDLAGCPRWVDDPNAPDCPQAPGQCGPPPVVDMGAYERQSCPADLDEDGDVGFPDLLEVLSTWGPCAGCAADLDGSGDVGFADLLVVLANWGPCPSCG